MANTVMILPVICIVLVATVSGTLRKCYSGGHAYGVGQVYATGCDLCTCQLSGPVCNHGFLCLLGKKRQIVSTSCEYAGVNHPVGSVYSTGTGLSVCHCTLTGPKCVYLPIRRRAVSPDTCTNNGRRYNLGETLAVNCHECRCTNTGWDCDKHMYWMCALGR